MKAILSTLTVLLLIAACAERPAGPPEMKETTSTQTPAEGWQVGSGGGIAEQNVQFAMETMGYQLYICVEHELCKLTSDEKSLLKKIRDGLSADGKVTTKVHFRSGEKTPDFFEVDGPHRLAVAKDGEIFFNLDVMYQRTEQGIHPLSISEALATLVHELGHIHGEKDHVYLANLGIKVQMTMLARTQQVVDMSPENHTFESFATAMIFDYWPKVPAPRLIVTRDNFRVDLTEELAEAVKGCRPGDRQKMFYLWNPHWIRAVDLGGHRVHTLVATPVIQCITPKSAIYMEDEGLVVISTMFDKNELMLLKYMNVPRIRFLRAKQEILDI